MRYLFLLLAFLGLATAGDWHGRSAPAGPKGRAPQSHSTTPSASQIAVITEDGTPTPRR